MALYVRLL